MSAADNKYIVELRALIVRLERDLRIQKDKTAKIFKFSTAKRRLVLEQIDEMDELCLESEKVADMLKAVIVERDQLKAEAVEWRVRVLELEQGSS